MDRARGIWYSTDGATWSKLISSPPFFQEQYSGGPPVSIVFDNRLWVILDHNSETGIWFTMPGGQTSCRPSAEFNADKTTGPAPLEVNFRDESLCRPDQWLWDFGDGSQSTDQNPRHTFSSAGNYTVRLTVKNGAGGSQQLLNITVFQSVSLPNSHAGKDWKRAVEKVPFGNREEFSVVVWNNSMWIIGGNKPGGIPGYNDSWYSRDGAHWTRAVQNAGFEARFRHSTAVFNDKLWVIGGIADSIDYTTGMHSPVEKNDTWFSSDGVTWTKVTPDPEFPPQVDHSSISFDNRLWVIGNGIWDSTDGIHWNRSGISGSSFSRLTPVVRDNRLWVLQNNYYAQFWSTTDGITRTPGATPPINEEENAIVTNSLAIADNKFWLFRALAPRIDGRNEYDKMHGELWNSDDGYNWVLVSDNVPFATGASGLNDFHLVTLSNRLYAYMNRFPPEGMATTEIWYTDL